MKTWEIERAFNEEIREKRKAGSGAFHKRGKGVKHGISGALRTPSYYMSKKEKDKLNGEVSVSFMYETIIPIEEFKLKDKELQKLMLTRWREIYDNMKIRTELGLSNKAFYDLVAELEIPKKTRIEKAGSRKVGRPRQAKPQTTAQVTPKKNLLDLVEESIQEEIKAKETPKNPTVQTIITNGLHVEYNGNYDADTINKILTKIQLLVDGESNKFRISLSLSEISK